MERRECYKMSSYQLELFPQSLDISCNHYLEADYESVIDTANKLPGYYYLPSGISRN